MFQKHTIQPLKKRFEKQCRKFYTRSIPQSINWGRVVQKVFIRNRLWSSRIRNFFKKTTHTCTCFRCRSFNDFYVVENCVIVCHCSSIHDACTLYWPYKIRLLSMQTTFLRRVDIPPFTNSLFCQPSGNLFYIYLTHYNCWYKKKTLLSDIADWIFLFYYLLLSTVALLQSL